MALQIIRWGQYTGSGVGPRSLSVTSFIPDLELPGVREHSPVRLRERGGKLTILLTVHSALCAGCWNYTDSLASISREFDVWDARLLIIVPGRIDDAGQVRVPIGKLLSDKRNAIAESGSATISVADRYGQIYDVVRAGASHTLPSARELAEWLKYLGTLCPE